jgi:hypothetical protein
MPVPDSPLPVPAMAAGRHPPPWYREPWPWLLFFPPAVAVVAGLVTMAIAIDSFDGVVSDDYYRQGLAINRSIDREAQARARGLSARLQFNPSGDRVRVAVSGDVSADGVLRLYLVRAARSGDDQQVELAPLAPGLYEGRLLHPLLGRWHLHLEDAGHRWRISATAQMPAERAIGLEPTPLNPRVTE